MSMFSELLESIYGRYVYFGTVLPPELVRQWLDHGDRGCPAPGGGVVVRSGAEGHTNTTWRWRSSGWLGLEPAAAKSRVRSHPA